MTNWSDTPEGTIARLDASLSRRGEDVVLQRFTIVDGAQLVAYQVDPWRVQVRAGSPQQLQSYPGEAPNTQVIASPTGLATWPGLPAKDDRLIIRGRPNNIETVSPIYVDGVLVRINIECRE